MSMQVGLAQYNSKMHWYDIYKPRNSGRKMLELYFLWLNHYVTIRAEGFVCLVQPLFFITCCTKWAKALQEALFRVAWHVGMHSAVFRTKNTALKTCNPAGFWITDCVAKAIGLPGFEYHKTILWTRVQTPVSERLFILPPRPEAPVSQRWV